jgi:drug/metabolite transporter (DMT)-like permease
LKEKFFYSQLLELNLAVLLISTSGVLGRYIELSVSEIIFMRAVMGGIILFAFCKIRHLNLILKSKDRRAVLFGGVLLGAHWISYFYALKLSNVAVGMLSLFTFPAITAILEPLITRQKFQLEHLILAGMILCGIYLLVPEFNFERDDFKGVWCGIFSAVCFSFRNIILKSKVDTYPQSVLMFYQLFVVSILLSPVLYFIDPSKLNSQLPSLTVLAIFTTAVGHTLFVRSLQHFSTVSVSIMSSLQPVYGILLGIILMREYPQLNTLAGGLIIVSTVVVESFRMKKLDGRQSS